MVQEAGGGGSAINKKVTLPGELRELFKKFSNSMKPASLEAFQKAAAAWVSKSADKASARAAVVRTMQGHSQWNGRGFSMPDGNTLGGLFVMTLHDGSFGEPRESSFAGGGSGSTGSAPLADSPFAGGGSTEIVGSSSFAGGGSTEFGSSFAGGGSMTFGPDGAPVGDKDYTLAGPPAPAPGTTKPPTTGANGGGTNTTTGSTPAGSPPAGGSSGAVSGGSSGIVGESVLQDTDFTGMPPGAELWKIGNAISVAYQIDPKDPTEGWVYYTFPTPEAFERAFPDGQSPTPRELTQQEADAKGALFIASTNLLRDDLAAGWEEGFMHGIANAVRTSPWLDDDPAVVAELLAATLEGRPVDDDYIKQQSGMNDGQIAYAKLAATASDDELGQYHLSHQQNVRKALTAAGVRNPDDAIVNYMSSKVADGSWSATNLTLQVEAVSNPYSSVTMDGGLAEIMSGGIEVKSLASEADSVKQFVKRWLGPRGDSYSDEFYRSWAGAILDDPNAQDDLTELMKKQRLALFPEYANENLTYEDIATPWKQEMASRWGTSVNDLDEEVLHKVIRANDVMEAGKILRGEGMKRGNKKVEMQAANEMLSAFGGPVVNPL